MPDKEHVENLKASEALVGQLEPVVISKRTGRVVSGEHRLRGNANWRTEYRDFTNDFEEELARIEYNNQRQVPEEELKLRFSHLAEAAVNDLDVEPKKVCSYLAEKLAGRYTRRRIEQLLDSKYKADTVPKKVETVSTSTTNLVDQMRQEGSEAKKAIDALEPALVSDELTFPFPDCKCGTCPHKNTCY